MHVINKDNILSIADSVNMAPIIKRITPSGLRPSFPSVRPEAFPPLQRPLQQAIDWWKFRGFPPEDCRRQALLYAIAKSTRAWMVCAAGVGFGADLYAMVRGVYDGGYIEATANGYDDEVQHPGCLEWVRECLMADRLAYNLSHSTMAQYVASGLPLAHIDLFQLDCIYSQGDLGRDIQLAVRTLSTKGIIVVTSMKDHVSWPADLKDSTGQAFDALLPLDADTIVLCRKHQVPA